MGLRVNKPDRESSAYVFAPGEFGAWKTYRELVRSKLDDVCKHLPLPHLSGEVTLKQLERLKPGGYVLQGPPNVDVLQSLPEFHDSDAETGVFAVHTQWIIVLGQKKTRDEIGHSLELPNVLDALKYQGLFQLCLHSEPGDADGLPSIESADIPHLASAVDNKAYIATRNGLSEYKAPRTSLPGNYGFSPEVTNAWSYWIREVLKLDEEQFHARGPDALRREFITKYFSPRIIPWDQEKKIAKLIHGKSKL